MRTFLNKHVLHSPQQRPMLRLVFHGGELREFGQEFALAFIQFGRGLNSDLNIKIALAVAVQHGHAFAPNAKRRSGLRALGDF